MRGWSVQTLKTFSAVHRKRSSISHRKRRSSLQELTRPLQEVHAMRMRRQQGKRRMWTEDGAELCWSLSAMHGGRGAMQHASICIS